MSNLSTRLAECRAELGITQTALAKMAGLKNQSIIGSLESGYRKSSSHIPKIAHALGVEPLWLADGRGPKRRDTLVSSIKNQANSLAEARNEKNWTKADLQRAAKLKSPSTLTELENGSRTESPQLPVIADALGVEVLWLQHGRGARYRQKITSTDFGNLLNSSKNNELESDAEFPRAQAGKNIKELASASRIKRADELSVIRQYDTGGAMGNGLLLRDQPGVIHGWQVNREWIDKNCRNNTGVKNLCIVTGFGDSMRPMYNPGDPLLIDSGVKIMESDGVYFFRINGEGFIKRLQRIPTKLGIVIFALSENKEYKDLRVWCGTDF